MQLEIYKNTDRRGLILTNMGNVKIHERTKHLFYNFNITSISKMKKWNQASNQNCNSNSTKASQFQIEITQNLKWNIYKPPPEFSEENSIEISSILNFDQVLSNYLTQKSNDSENDCDTLRILFRQFNEMNNHLNEISNRLNTTSIDQLIDRQLFIKTIYDMVDENLELPYILNENTTIEFLNKINIEFFQNDHMVTLIFDIPLYMHTQFYRVYVKPILGKRGPLIAKTNVTHAAMTMNKIMFWNITEFQTLCFVRGEINKNFGETFFCRKTTSNYQCEHDLLKTNKRGKSCLQRTPKRNIITRIQNKFYITLYNPIVLQIICEDMEYFIKLIEDSNLINSRNCFLNSSFYTYNPTNPTTMLISYEMKPSNQFKTYDFDFLDIDLSDSDDFILIILLISTILLSAIIAIIIIICLAKKRIQEIYEITKHEYATIDYYTNIHQFLETDV